VSRTTVNDQPQHRVASAAFAQLSGMLAAGRPVEAILSGVAHAIKDSIDAVADVSVSVIDELGCRTVAFTGTCAIELDEAQYDLNSGPCLDAARTERTVALNTGSDSEYPEFSRLANSHGVRHTLSIGLPTRARSAAGLNIYGTGQARFTDDERTLAGAFANYTLAAISRASPSADAAPPPGWQTAMTSRAVVDRAALQVMATRTCTREQALQQLLDLARSQGRRLVDIAQSIVD
jgi:GAF domain-containing protein